MEIVTESVLTKKTPGTGEFYRTFKENSNIIFYITMYVTPPNKNPTM